MFPCSQRFSGIAASPRRLAVIAADSILQGEGETISRRHERGCVLSGSGRAYHGVARNSVCLIDAGDFVSSTPASEKTRNVWKLNQTSIFFQSGVRRRSTKCAHSHQKPLIKPIFYEKMHVFSSTPVSKKRATWKLDQKSMFFRGKCGGGAKNAQIRI